MPAKLVTGSRLPLALAATALAAYALGFGNAYTLRLLTISGCYALLVIGYQFIFGQAGAFSLAQGAFFGIGAYTTGILASQFGWGFSATFPLSILLPGAAALLMALPAIRLESHYFALATLGAAQVVLLIGVNWQSVTGGANGIAGIPDIAVFDMEIHHGLPLLAFVWGCVALGAWPLWQLGRNLYGRAFHAMRELDIAAPALGIDAGRLRLAAFLLSALYAGAAGALYAHTVQVVSPSVLELPLMVSCLAMAVIGGRGNAAGAIIGAVLLVHLPEWFRFLSNSYLIAYGAALLVAIIAAPWGIVGALERLFPIRMREAPAPIPFSPRTRTALDSEPALALHDVAMAFGGVTALNGVGLAIRSGEVVGLIGPNGSGKTTLVNLATGLYRAERGRILFRGRDITEAPPHRIARLGLARSFQAAHLAEEMTVLDNVAAARLPATHAFARGWSGAALRQAQGEAMFLLCGLGIDEAAQRLCRDLPHGMKRQVEIARALALEPDMLILDEPAAGLSPAEQVLLAALLKSLSQQGLTLLIVEHNMPFLMPLVTRMVCLENGRIIADGTPEKVSADSRVVEAYLGTALAQGGADG